MINNYTSIYHSTTLSFILNSLMLSFGLFGNLIVMIVFSSKALKKFPSRNIYRALIIFDSITLIYNVNNEFLTIFNINWWWTSEILFKISVYLMTAFSTPYLLVFISIEKYITIRYPLTKIIKNQIFQTVIVFFLIACNLIVYHLIFYSKLKPVDFTSNQYNSTSESNEPFEPREAIHIASIINLIYLAGLPFVLMLIFTILLIRTIFKSRIRILRQNNQHDRNRLKKDIQFAISSIFMNLFYLLLYLPSCIYAILHSDAFVFKTDLYNIFVSLTFLNFCDHFYILICFNSVFRREVLIIFRLKSRLFQANVSKQRVLNNVIT